MVGNRTSDNTSPNDYDTGFVWKTFRHRTLRSTRLFPRNDIGRNSINHNFTNESIGSQPILKPKFTWGFLITIPVYIWQCIWTNYQEFTLNINLVYWRYGSDVTNRAAAMITIAKTTCPRFVVQFLGTPNNKATRRPPNHQTKPPAMINSKSATFISNYFVRGHHLSS